MLNYLWGGMLLAGMLWGALNGTWNEVTQALSGLCKRIRESGSYYARNSFILVWHHGDRNPGRTGGMAYRAHDTAP